MTSSSLFLVLSHVTDIFLAKIRTFLLNPAAAIEGADDEKRSDFANWLAMIAFLAKVKVR